MNTNDIKAFAVGVGANVLTQVQFEALASLIANGFVAGIADSKQLNKVWRQSSFVAAAVAQFVVDVAGVDVLDDGDVAALAAKIQAGIDARVAAGAPALSNTNPVMDGVAAPGAATTAARGDHGHPTDTSRAPLASPVFTGTPQAPTAAAGTNTNQLATTAFVKAAIDALVNAAPAALDTLKELADALGDDPNFATTMTNALAAKAALATAQTFTAAQRGAVVALVDGATITPDFAAGNNFSLTIGGNRTLANPTNIVAGQSGIITVTQDATGNRTLAFGSYYKFGGGTVPSLTSTAAAVDDLAYYVRDATHIDLRIHNDVK